MATKRFNAHDDFLSLGKKLQAQTEELDRVESSKAKHTALLLDSRRALDIARADMRAQRPEFCDKVRQAFGRSKVVGVRTQLHDLKQRHQLVAAETSAFESRAEKVAKEVLVRSHEEKNLHKEVLALNQELYLTNLEAKELSIELEYEHTTKEHILGLIARAQNELHAQISERDILRKEEHDIAKIATTQKDRLAAFTSMNFKLLQDIS